MSSKKLYDLVLGLSHSRVDVLLREGVKKSDPSIFGELLRKGYDDDFEPTKIGQPTSFAPGSIGKLCVLADRLKNGEELFHPNDEQVLVSNRGRVLAKEVVKRGVG